MGSTSVEWVVACLTDLKFAYEATSVFISEVEAARRAERGFPFSRFHFGLRALAGMFKDFLRLVESPL
jgi:hypothetical protein